MHACIIIIFAVLKEQSAKRTACVRTCELYWYMYMRHMHMHMSSLGSVVDNCVHATSICIVAAKMFQDFILSYFCYSTILKCPLHSNSYALSVTELKGTE